MQHELQTKMNRNKKTTYYINLKHEAIKLVMEREKNSFGKRNRSFECNIECEFP